MIGCVSTVTLMDSEAVQMDVPEDCAEEVDLKIPENRIEEVDRDVLEDLQE